MIGKPLALAGAEVSSMNIPSPQRMTIFRLATALGLAFSSVAFAQSPPPAPQTPTANMPPDAPAPPPASPQLPVVTQSSRVRAFSAGPGGEIRSLYLQNGSVVVVAPGLGVQLGAVVRKGEKITVTGPQSEINGQSLLAAASVRLNDRTFSANAPSSPPPGPGPLAAGAVPPPPPPPDGMAPPPPPQN
jgi:hypothetical protein